MRVKRDPLLRLRRLYVGPSAQKKFYVCPSVLRRLSISDLQRAAISRKRYTQQADIFAETHLSCHYSGLLIELLNEN